jgi:hypothetical protein
MSADALGVAADESEAEALPEQQPVGSSSDREVISRCVIAGALVTMGVVRVRSWRATQAMHLAPGPTADSLPDDELAARLGTGTVEATEAAQPSGARAAGRFGGRPVHEPGGAGAGGQSAVPPSVAAEGTADEGQPTPSTAVPRDEVRRSRRREE